MYKRQDRGRQYRTGVYYTDEGDHEVIAQVFAEEEKQLGSKIAVELEPLRHYIPAEDYHQDYLKKNPGGYCHIDVTDADQPLIDPSAYQKPDQETLKAKLTAEQYQVCLLYTSLHLDQLLPALKSVFSGVFTGTAAMGGFAGATVKMAIQKGVARGVFSNESGLGSAPIAAAAAKSNEPVEQGLISMTGTFIDTIIICSLTGLSLLVSGEWMACLLYTSAFRSVKS